MTATKSILETLFTMTALSAFTCVMLVLILLNKKATVCIGEPNPLIRIIEITILVIAILYALLKIGRNLRKGIYWMAGVMFKCIGKQSQQ